MHSSLTTLVASDLSLPGRSTSFVRCRPSGYLRHHLPGTGLRHTPGTALRPLQHRPLSRLVLTNAAGGKLLHLERPDLMQEFNPDHNPGIEPTKLTLGSGRSVSWDFSANGHLRPESLLPTSHVRVVWRCEAHGTWKTSPSDRRGASLVALHLSKVWAAS
ncbi:hypothetical protein WJX73_004306 [Symbiochloris irregularis]|uniref:Treble clef zinc finger domain-containing protein n=1 Tax=Symbiochloris irregularis TaxID=706552 RepID=A0AAW1NQ03_9CHLO